MVLSGYGKRAGEDLFDNTNDCSGSCNSGEYSGLTTPNLRPILARMSLKRRGTCVFWKAGRA
jgi:hypothetical protein